MQGAELLPGASRHVAMAGQNRFGILYLDLILVGRCHFSTHFLLGMLVTAMGSHLGVGEFTTHFGRDFSDTNGIIHHPFFTQLLVGIGMFTGGTVLAANCSGCFTNWAY